MIFSQQPGLRGAMISRAMNRVRRETQTIRPTFVAFFVVAAFASMHSMAFAESGPKTEDEKAFYAIGTGMGTQLSAFAPISDHEVELLVKGLRDAIAGNAPSDEPEASRGRIRALTQSRQAVALELEKKASASFLAAEAKRPGAKQTASGLIISTIEAGTGASPTSADKVKVHYHGTLRDGTVFDSSVERDRPAEFPLTRVIPCWTEGVAMMKVGGKSKLVCPAGIAYGDQRKGQIPGGAALVFEVELLEIMK